MRSIRLPFARFARNDRGSTALLFGLVFFVTCSVAGLCFDMARAHRVATRVSSSIDAAALAAAKAMMEQDNLSDSQIRQIALDFLSTQTASLANAGLQLGTPAILLDRLTGEVKITTNINVETTFGKILTINELNFNRGSTVAYNPTRIELAMVLDVTGSMNDNGKIAAMKGAAKDVIDILVDPNKPNLTRVALVPYSAAVNVGTYRDIASGGDSTDGCVMERLFPANRDNDEVSGGGNNFAVNGQLNSPTNGHYVCPNAVLNPLSSDKSALKATIDSYAASGWTAGHLGITWGWNVLSPKWNSVFSGPALAAPYSDLRYKKVMLLMTDGIFNTSYTAGTSDAQQTQESSDRALAMCAAMKAQNITIYSVAVQAPIEAENLLRACATSPSHYFDANNNTALHDAFVTIAMQLQQLRVSK